MVLIFIALIVYSTVESSTKFFIGSNKEYLMAIIKLFNAALLKMTNLNILQTNT